MKSLRSTFLVLALVFVAGVAFCAPAPAAATVNVVTTLPAYASIASSIGGDRVEVSSIATGEQDAHFVKAKPSYALSLRRADLFVTTGLDLELWAPSLVDKSGNTKIRDGQPGFVSASQGVHLLDVPSALSRSAGDVHIYGNPHIYTSPINAKVIAGNIAAGLQRIDPDGAAVYQANLQAFRQRIDKALYGDALLEVLDAATLDPLARDGKLIPFLQSQKLDGQPLVNRLGGWLGKAQGSFYGKKIVAYHKNWIYFTTLFGLTIADYVEPKPGIPPSAKHVHSLIDLMEQQQVSVLFAASYFAEHQVRSIAERTSATAVIVPIGPEDVGPDGYFDLIDGWVDDLSDAFQTAGSR